MLQNWGCPREEAAEMLSKKGYEAKDNVTEDHFYNDFKDLWVFGIECLEEMARIVDQRTLKANGKTVPMAEWKRMENLHREALKSCGKTALAQTLLILV